MNIENLMDCTHWKWKIICLFLFCLDIVHVLFCIPKILLFIKLKEKQQHILSKLTFDGLYTLKMKNNRSIFVLAAITA